MHKPKTLEEAFNLVREQKPQATVPASDPFNNFVSTLTKVVVQEKKTTGSKQREIKKEPVVESVEEIKEEIRIAQALISLEEALIKAKQEIALQQELKEQEEFEYKQMLLEKEKARKKALEEKEKRIQMLVEQERARRQKQTFLVEKEDNDEEDENEDEEEESQEQQTPESESQSEEQPSPANPYVKELAKSTQFDVSKPKVDEKQSEIKRMISEQINNELEAFRRQLFSSNLMMGGGGGGGTNAVQYAAGGTMNGNLNVNGHILSGGLDLSEAIRNTVAAAVADIGSITLPDPLIVKDISF